MILKRTLVLPTLLCVAGRGVHSYNTGFDYDKQLKDDRKELRRGLRWHKMENEGHHGGGMMGMGHHDMGMSGHMEAIHNLMWNRDQIERTVNDTFDGVLTRTTSDDPEVAKWIVRHAQEMKGRLESGKPVRRWDPLFEAIFDNHDLITLDYEELWQENGGCEGVSVTEYSSTSQFGVALIQAHAAAVTGFLDPVNGHANMHNIHPVPNMTDSAQTKDEVELREAVSADEMGSSKESEE